MSYAIYNKLTSSLIRVEPTLDFTYDTTLESFKEIADGYSGEVTWSPDHLDFKDLLNDTEIHISVIDFINRLTIPERIGIHTLSNTDPIVKDLLYMLQVIPFVNLVSPNIKMGLGYLYQQGILTAERMIQIRGY